MARKKVVIIGGGFGGLQVAQQLKDAPLDLLVIDKCNYHLFQPLLYQVASAALAPRDIALPIREVLKNQENTSVVLGEVTHIDKEQKRVTLGDGEKVPFDFLVVATGTKQSYFGNDQWRELAPGLKTLSDALQIRENILLAFEMAEACEDLESARKYLNFVIVGGGPTGVELAGAIAEIAHKTMLKNFRKIDPTKTQVYLIEGGPRILPPFPEPLSKRAKSDLENLGVQIINGTHVTEITDEGVHLGERSIPSKTVIWAAGNQAPEFLQTLGAKQDKQRRVVVGKDLSIPDCPYIFVIGDSAHALGSDGNPLPGLAPVAMQQGAFVAKIIQQNTPLEKRSSFLYNDRGILAAIGKTKAVAAIGKKQFTGLTAWFIWAFVHVFELVGFRSRIFVMIGWLFWFVTGRRSSRIIFNSLRKK